MGIRARIFAIDAVLRFKIVGIGPGPMPIQCRTYLLSSHMTLQRHQPSIPLLTQDTFMAVTLPDHVDIVIRNDRWASTWLRASRRIAIWKSGLPGSAEAVVYGREIRST